ncbi:hypothetical protein [Tissierella sp.]|uniref:hypothetical protein n=1 Tax=Tissierella sp. TaxID=41274 RepID=UPI0028A7CBCF|nr:hypothetical protein [Tissierella sp.]
MLIELETELITLCEEVINILYELKEKELITEEEFNIHSKKKLNFIEKTTKIFTMQ